MPVYNVKTPQGERVVEATSRKDALNHCVSGDYSADPLTPVQMAEKFRSGAQIEQTEGAKEAAKKKSDDNKSQGDIEDVTKSKTPPKADDKPKAAAKDEAPKKDASKKAA